MRGALSGFETALLIVAVLGMAAFAVGLADIHHTFELIGVGSVVVTMIMVCVRIASSSRRTKRA